MWQKRRTDTDFSEEVRAHIALESDQLVASGLAPDAARTAAVRRFGSLVAAEERHYDSSRWVWLSQILQDLRYGWRGLGRNPAFLLTTVLTLGVGLALVTVVFSIFNAYVLRPFAVVDPHQLHHIGWRGTDTSGQVFRWRDYEQFAARRDLFQDVVAERTRVVTLDDGDGRPLVASHVSPNFFDALGPRLLLGRALGAADAMVASETSTAVVLSESAWRRFFNADRDVIGRVVAIAGTRSVIVGVLGGEFTGLDDSPRDVWFTMDADAAGVAIDSADARDRPVQLTGRLRRDVTPEQASAGLTPLVASVIESSGSRPSSVRAEMTASATPNPLTRDLLAMLSPVFVAFGLVLAAVCANVSNVMLARGNARHREMALRLSLGASRGRVVRQLMTEGLLLAVISGVVALGLAALCLRLGVGLFLGAMPPMVSTLIRVVPLDFDARVFLFTLAASASAAVGFALAPALHATSLSLVPALRGEMRRGLNSSLVRNVLVGGQVAVAVVLLVIAATLVRNTNVLSATPLGLDPRSVISINLRGDDHDRLIAPLAGRLADDSRVAAVVVTSTNPLFERLRAVAARPDEANRAATRTRYTFVSPAYFEMLGVPIVRGRGFSDAEAATMSRVAVVSRATAQTFWPGSDPIGQVVRIDAPGNRPVDDLSDYDLLTVIGVTDDVVSGMVFDGKDTGHIYLPLRADSPHARALLVQSRAGAPLTPADLREAFLDVDGGAHVFEALPLDNMLSLQLFPVRMAAWIGSLLGGIALALSVFGLYGVLSYSLGQRTREIGIRMALGATAGHVVRMVMAQSARLAGYGAIVGLALAGATLTFLASVVRLANVSLIDVRAFAAAVVIVTVATLLAAFMPTRRAARINPTDAMRQD